MKRKTYDPEDLRLLTSSFSAALLHSGAINDIVALVSQGLDEDMRRAQILKHHPYAISPIDHGKRYLTYVVDDDGKRRPIKKKTKEAVEDALVEFYSKGLNPATLNLARLWPLYKRNDLDCGNYANVQRMESTWNQYMSDDPLMQMNIHQIGTSDIKAFIAQVSKRHELSAHKILDVKTVLNGLFDYALDKRFTDRNPARETRVKAKRYAVKTQRRKNANEVIFSEKEQEMVIREAMADYEATHNMADLGIALNFYLGLRAGELSALQWTDEDVPNCVLTVCRSESVHYEVDGHDHTYKNGVDVVDHLKGYKDFRRVPMCQAAIDILAIAKKGHLKSGVISPWIFTNARGERLKANSFQNRLRRINEKLGLPQRSIHGIRKTFASRLIDSRELSLVEIRDILGHNDSQTTLNYYGFPVGSEKERAESISSALKAVGFEEMVSKSSKMVSKSAKTKSPGTLIK